MVMWGNGDGCAISRESAVRTLRRVESKIQRVGNRWLLCGVVFGLVTMAGCTKSADKSPEGLSGRLLGIADMPGEWRETQRDVFAQRSNENPSIDPSVWCPKASAEVEKLTTLAGNAGADVEMQAESSGVEIPRLMRLQAWRNDAVREYFATLQTVVNICDGAKWNADPGVSEEMWKIDGPEVGDESVSWGSTTVPPSGTDKAKANGRTTVARLGEVIMVLQIGDFTTTTGSPTLSDGEWREIVQRAADKLADG